MTLNTLLTTPVMQAVGWTLVHSLWQGVLVALLLSVSLFTLRKADATLRYVLSCTALMLMVSLPLITYGTLAPNQTTTAFGALPPSDTLSTQASPLRQVLQQPVASQVTQPEPLLATGEASAQTLTLPRAPEAYLPWLVGLWLLGVIVLSLRLVGGLIASHSLKTNYTQAVSPILEATLQRLCEKLQLRQAPQLRESLAAATPMMIGALKPVILLPSSVLSGLSSAQLELILAHELAHIKRHDYLANLLQAVAETLLFYHPAVWWVSGIIRQEREHCCDNLAITLCKSDKRDYAQTLAKLEHLRPSLQLAVAANGGSLLKRIQRLAGKPASNHSGHWLSGLALLIIPLLILSVATAQAQLPLEIEANIDSFVENRLAAFGAPGLQAAVIQDGQVTFNKSYGSADVASQTAMSVDTPMRLGWISANITALALLQLAEQDRVDLDAPLDTYLPWVRFRSSADVTARKLMTSFVLTDPANPQSMFDTFLGDVPDTKQAYIESLMVDGELRPALSDTHQWASNYILLGALIEAVTQSSFEAHVQEAIFAPLGVEASYGLEQAQALGLSTGYVYPFQSGGLTPSDDLPPAIYNPAYGLMMNSRDLSTVLRLFMDGGSYDGGQLVSTESIEAILNTTLWNKRNIGGKTVVEAYGAFRNGTAVLSFLPDEHFGIVSLANINTGSGGNPHFQVMGSLSLALGVLSDDSIFAKSEPQPTTADVNDVNVTERFAVSAGTYTSALGDLTLGVEDGQLTGSLLGSSFTLLPSRNLNDLIIQSDLESINGLTITINPFGESGILHLEDRQFAYKLP